MSALWLCGCGPSPILLNECSTIAVIITQTELYFSSKHDKQDRSSDLRVLSCILLKTFLFIYLFMFLGPDEFVIAPYIQEELMLPPEAG